MFSTMQIHWFSIFNSFMMVIFLTGLVSMILMRTLRNDYAKYAREDDDLETLVMFFFSCLAMIVYSYAISCANRISSLFRYNLDLELLIFSQTFDNCFSGCRDPNKINKGCSF